MFDFTVDNPDYKKMNRRPDLNHQVLENVFGKALSDLMINTSPRSLYHINVLNMHNTSTVLDSIQYLISFYSLVRIYSPKLIAIEQCITGNDELRSDFNGDINFNTTNLIYGMQTGTLFGYTNDLTSGLLVMNKLSDSENVVVFIDSNQTYQCKKLTDTIMDEMNGLYVNQRGSFAFNSKYSSDKHVQIQYDDVKYLENEHEPLSEEDFFEHTIMGLKLPPYEVYKYFDENKEKYINEILVSRDLTQSRTMAHLDTTSMEALNSLIGIKVHDDVVKMINREFRKNPSSTEMALQY